MRRELAARTADLVSLQIVVRDGQAFCSDLKRRAERYGRHPNDIKILPGLTPVVGRTDEAAQEKPATLQALMDERRVSDFGFSLLATYYPGVLQRDTPCVTSRQDRENEPSPASHHGDVLEPNRHAMELFSAMVSALRLQPKLVSADGSFALHPEAM